MNPAPAPAAGADTPPPASRRWGKFAGHLIGLLLLGAAVWAVAAQSRATGGGGDLSRIWSAARSAPGRAWLLAALLILPALNWIIVSVSFWILMRRYGRVGLYEMLRLIGVAWLGNYLPLRPGMIGRIAYHRAVNRIAVADSVRAVALGTFCGLGAVGSVVLLAAAMRGVSSLAPWALALAALPAAGLLAWAALRRAGGPARAAAFIPLVYAIRCIDMIVWVLRYSVVFALIGSPLPPSGAVAITGVSQIAMAIPFSGNGLGLREWAVGLTAGALPPANAPARPPDPNPTSPDPAAPLARSLNPAALRGVEAELINRTAELAVAVPVGLLSYFSLRSRRAAPPPA